MSKTTADVSLRASALLQPATFHHADYKFSAPPYRAWTIASTRAIKLDIFWICFLMPSYVLRKKTCAY